MSPKCVYIFGKSQMSGGDYYLRKEASSLMGIWKNEWALMRENYNAVVQWLSARQNGHYMDIYLSAIGYRNVSIYGMNEIGNCVIRELRNSATIKILYVIDQGSPKLYFDVDCYRLENLPKDSVPDIVIVALPFLFEKVKLDIEKYLTCPIISITEIVYEMEKN